MIQDKAAIEAIYEPIQRELAQVEKRLLAVASDEHSALTELLDHVMKSPGKRIRPALTLLASRFHPHGANLPVVMATAVELLHAASLIHDDTVDDSPTRRGIATVSSLWGSHVAVIVGDYVLATAAAFVCDTENLLAIRRFSETVIELSSAQLREVFDAYKWDYTYEQYEARISSKTASLFRTAAEGGAIVSGAPETTSHLLAQYGYGLGRAFQVVDDILDFEGTAEEVGKPVGHDLLQGTLTLPAMLLLQRYPDNNPIIQLFQGKDTEANHQRALEMIRNSTVIQDSYAVARRFRDEATNALHQLPDTRERRSLVDLGTYVVERRR